MEDFIADLHLALISMHGHHLDQFMLVISGFSSWFSWMLAVAILLYGIGVHHNLHQSELLDEVPAENQTPCWQTIGWHSLPLAAQLLSTLIVQPLKYIFHLPRPYPWFMSHYPDVNLHIPYELDCAYSLSFPSGHTATAFAIATILYLMMPKNFSPGGKMLIALFLFGCATLVAYSRIYLSQHFFHDVAAGALIGIFAAWAVYRIWVVLQSRNSKMY